MMRAISSADFVSKPCDASFWLSVVRCWRREAESVLESSFPWAPAPSCVVVLVNIKVCPQNLLYLHSRQGTQNSGRSRCHFNVIWSYTSQGFPEGIVKGRTHPPDGLVLAVGPCAIGEKHSRDAGLEINPEGAAAVSQVAYG